MTEDQINESLDSYPPTPANNSTMQAMLEAAQAGAKEAREWFGKGKRELGIKVKSEDFIDYNGYQDLLTKADKACQRVILEKLRAFKDIPILAEEGGMDRETDAMREAGERWVVDPIDGTLPFTEGKTHFSQTIALQKLNANGTWQTVTGAVGIPMEESVYLADEQGAWKQEGNGMCSLKITAPATTDFNSVRGAFDGKKVETVFYVANNQERYKPVGEHMLKSLGESASRQFSTAHQLVKMTDGGVNAAIVGGDGLKHPWDTDAAFFIAQKAGAQLVESTLGDQPVKYLGQTAALARAAQFTAEASYKTITAQPQRGADGR